MKRIRFRGNTKNWIKGRNFSDDVTQSKMLCKEMQKFMDAKHYDDAMLIYGKYAGKHNDYTNLMFIKALKGCMDIETGKEFLSKLDIHNIGQCSIQYISSIIGYCGKIGDVITAEKVFQSVNDKKMDVQCVATMMRCYMDNKEWSKAIKCYEGFKGKHNNITITLVVKSSMEINLFEKCKNIVDKLDMDNIKGSIEFMTVLIEYYGYVEIESALNIYQRMGKRDLKCLVTIMKGCLYNGYNQKAMELYQNYPGKHNDYSNSLYIRACINSNNFARGKIERLFNLSNIEIYSIQFLTILIEFYGNIDIQMALKIYENIKPSKIDNKCLATTMKCLINNNLMDKAIELYDNYDGIHNNFTNTLYIKACLKLGKYDKCSKLVKDFNIGNINQFSQEFATILIEYYGRTNQYNEVIQLYDQYNGDHNDVINIVLIKALMNTNKYDECKQRISKMNIVDINQHSSEFIATLIDFYGNAGDADNALYMFELLSDEKKDNNCVGAILNVCKNKQLYDMVMHIFDSMKDNTHIIMDAYIYSIVLHCCGEMVSNVKGIQIVNELKNMNQYDIYSHPYVLSAIIAMYAKCSEFDMAIQTFNENKSIITKDLQNIIIYYAVIMECYAKKGDIQQTILLYQELKSYNITVSDTIYCIIINACSHAGYTEQASQIFSEYTQKSSSNMDGNVISSMVDCFGRKGYLNDAEQIYITYGNDINISDKSRIDMLTSLLSFCKIYNDFDRSQRIFNIIMDIYDKNRNIEFNSSLHVIMSQICRQHNQMNFMENMDQRLRKLSLKSSMN